MAISVIIHINDTDPILCEIEELPTPSDQILTVTGPRRVDGKDLHYLAAGVTTVIFPMHRITFIELMPR
ncbi:MAG: hypothetical protein HC806_08360, partial [Anaerolineae bacterium]|nr:hypothetical protein [Anaerolineae bacterium]